MDMSDCDDFARQLAREQIASHALQGLLAHHGCGFDLYSREEDGPGLDKSDPYVQQILAKKAARRAENKFLLAQEAIAYADALILMLKAAEGQASSQPCPKSLAEALGLRFGFCPGGTSDAETAKAAAEPPKCNEACCE